MSPNPASCRRWAQLSSHGFTFLSVTHSQHVPRDHVLFAAYDGGTIAICCCSRQYYVSSYRGNTIVAILRMKAQGRSPAILMAPTTASSSGSQWKPASQGHDGQEGCWTFLITAAQKVLCSTEKRLQLPLNQDNSTTPFYWLPFNCEVLGLDCH